MKINKLFHWLYFIVMMLPIFSIPIFAIYSHRHNIDSYSVTTMSSQSYTINQLFAWGKGVNNDLSGWNYDDSSFSLSLGSDPVVSDSTYLVFGAFSNSDDIVFSSIDFDVNTNDKLYISLYYNQYRTFDECGIQLRDVDEHDASFTLPAQPYIQGDESLSFYHYVLDVDNIDISSFNHFCIYLWNDGSYTSYLNVNFIQVFNLSSIFGVGNEPSADLFKSYLTQDYYDYGVDYYINVPITITYNDTDIGSQFLYVSYNYVDKYFNYDNVFNFGSLYSWLNFNFFNGSAPLGFFIFWHLLIYWLLTSLLWLLFDVLMYVPLLVHRWLDKASIS